MNEASLPTTNSPRLFPGPEHRRFAWEGGPPGALLVHGFPGTPAEMRAPGEALRRAGWTARGPLLPGFGPQILTLPERHPLEWTGAVRAELDDLAREHAPVMLIGYSMGGAVALHVAAARPPDALVLFAPFWRLDAKLWQRLLFAFMRRFFPVFRPFARADFANPRLRALLANGLPGLDLDDEETRRALREFRVPLRFIEEVAGTLGQGAFRLAGGLRARGGGPLPVLVVQGAQDEVVRATRTRELLARLPGRPRYVEVPAGHTLLDPQGAAWPQVERALLDFAHAVRAREE